MTDFDLSRLRLPALPATPPDGQSPRSFWDFIGDAIVGFFGGVLDVLDGADRLARGADVLARKYGWGISTSWPPGLVMAIGSLPAHRSRNAVDACIVDYYQRNEWLELEKLVATICSHESVTAARARALRDVIGLLRAAPGMYNAATFALPTLFPELEGICRDFVNADLAGRYQRLKKRPTIVKYAVHILRLKAYPIERYGLRLISNVVYKRHGDTSPRRGKRLSRHIQLHRGSEGARHLTDVVRVLLMIDLVAFLIDVRRGCMNEYIEQRRAWGEYLSDAAARGHESIKLGLRPSDLLRQSQGKPVLPPPLPLSLTRMQPRQLGDSAPPTVAAEPPAF